MSNYIGNPEEFSGTLALAYGPHVVSGHVIQKVTEGVGDNAQTTVVVWLGEGPWNRIVSAYWAGGLIDPSNYHFHPGYLANSMDQAVISLNPATGLTEYNQGVDPWNVGGQTYSGTAYVIIKLPTGITSEDDLGPLKFICECLRVADYDNQGRQLDKDGNIVGQANEAPKPEWFFYSTNPALCMADLLLVRRNLPKSRINWQKWYEWKLFNNVDITWIGGSVPDRPVFTNVSATGVLGANGGFAKVSGGNAWNCGATTVSIFPENTVSFFEFDVGAGTWSGGVTLSNAMESSVQLYLGFQGNVANAGDESGILSVARQGFPHTVIGNWVAGDRFRVGCESDGTLYVAQNGIKLNVSSIPPFVPGLHGALALFHEGADILRSTMSPINTGTGTERTRKRFECGLAFSNQTDISAAIEAILFISCAEMQDGEQLVFLPPTTAASPRQKVFDFTESNMSPDTFRTYRLARDQKPTKLTGVFRDADSPTLKEATDYASRDALVDLLGRENPGGEIYLGTITRGQAQCILNFYMRRQSDLDLYCAFSAFGTAWKVMPGDIVTVAKDETDWNAVKFEVIEATDETSVDTPDVRTFVCQLFNEATYSDSDQTPLSANVTDLVTNVIDKPKTPTGFTAQFLLNAVRYQWDKPDDFNIIREYEVWSSLDTNNISNLLWHGLANGWTELFTAGAPNSITRYLRAVSVIGQKSDFAQLTQNIDVVVPPTNYTIVYDGSVLRHSWSPSNPATGIIRYEVATDSNFTNILFSGLDTAFVETVTGTTSVTRYLRAIGILEKPSSSISTSTIVGAPNPPTAGTNTYNGASIVWSWQPSTSSPVAYYEITNSTGTVVLDRVPFTTWTEPQIRGIASYSRRVYTVLTSGVRSTAFLTLGYTIPAPNPINGLQVNFDVNTGLIRWSWTPSNSIDVESIVLNDNAGILPAIVANKGANSITEVPTEGAATIRRNATVVSTNGQSSSITFAIFTAPIPPTPTITLNKQYPSSADLTVTSSAPSRSIKNTVVLVSTASGAGFDANLIQTLPEAGKQERVTVFGRASLNTNLYIKVRYIDVWGQQSGVSNELATTFTPFLGTDLSNNTVTSLQLLLNNFDNLAENPGFERGNVGWNNLNGLAIVSNTGGEISGKWSLVSGFSTSARSGINNTKVDCRPGDTFYAETKLIAFASSPTSFPQAGIKMIWLNSDNVVIGISTVSNPVVNSTVSLNGGTFTAPANAVYAQLQCFIDASSDSTQWSIGFDDVYWRKMITSALIGVAVIQTAHIADLSVTNEKVLNLSAEKLVAATGDIGLLFADKIVGNSFVPTPNLITTLNGSITDSSTSLTLTSVVGLDTKGSVKIDDEIIYFESRTGNTLSTLTRGVEDTVAAAHNNGAQVTGRGRGWMFEPQRGTAFPGQGQLNSGLRIQDQLFTDIQARATTAINNYKFWRGPDRDIVPTSAVVSYFIQDAVPDSINNRMFVALELGVDEQFNPAFAGVVNGSSIDHVKLNILNKFGEQVGYDRYGAFNGKGTVWSGTYPRKYADGWDEAIFRVQIHNIFGYSEPLYVVGSNSPGFQTTAPAFLAKQNCPMELSVVATGPDTIVATWSPATSNASTQKLKVRTRAADTALSTWANPPKPWNPWVDAVTGLGSTVNTATWTSATPFTEYEFQVENAGSAGATSNIAYIQTPPQSITLSRPAPSNVMGSVQSTTSIAWSWVRNATDNSDVEYRLTDNGTPGSWTSLGSASQTTLTTSGLTANHSYILEVRNKWSSGTTLSNVASSNAVTTPTSNISSNDPSSLILIAPARGQIQASWTNNGSVAQTLEYKLHTSGSWTTVSLGAVNSHTISSLLDNRLYDVRVKATAGSNYITDSTFTNDAPEDDRYCVTLDSLITLQFGLVEEAGSITTDDIIMTGKYNKSEIAEIEISQAYTICYVRNEFGDVLKCSLTHPFITNLEETEIMTAREISQRINAGETVSVKMNDLGREYMARVAMPVMMQYTSPQTTKVWIPKLLHPDHTFIANRFVCHNIKPIF